MKNDNYKFRYKSMLPLFVMSLACFVGMMLMSSASKADVVYSFIKVKCNPESQTAILRGFYVDNEEGEKKTKTQENNIYPLDRITANRFQGKSEKINICNFGDGQTASFIAQESHEHPRADGLILFLNNKETNGWHTLAYGGWTLEIHSLGLGQFDLHHCFDESPPVKQPKCKNWSISADKIVEPPPDPVKIKE